MTIAVKICGLTDEAGLAAAVAAGADYVGFVFFHRSPRYLDPAEAATLLDGLPPAADGGPRRVGLFVNPGDADLDAVLSRVRLDMVQLHGGEPPDRVDAVRIACGLPVIKAIGVETATDLEEANRYAAAADLLLLDARPPKGATRPGGNAQAFDWSIVSGWKAPLPWLLAGGLTPDNVCDALRLTGAPGVDVSSGVERHPGEKDPEQIRRFIATVREAE